MTKRYLLMKKMGGTKKITKKEALEDPKRFFINTLAILSFMNKEISKIVNEEVPTRARKRQKEIVEKFSKEDKKEMARYIKWLKTPFEKQRQFTTTSNLVKEFTSESVTRFGHQNRFQLFMKEMSIVYLITEFEGFLKRILLNVFYIKPQILHASDKSVSFSEVFATKDRDSLIRVMIEKEINNLIKDDIDEISKYLKKQFKIDLSKNKDWNQFKERFYRRHIIIHNNLYPDEKYRKKSGYKGRKTRLVIQDPYLNRSFSLYRKYAILITSNMIKKFA